MATLPSERILDQDWLKKLDVLQDMPVGSIYTLPLARQLIEGNPYMAGVHGNVLVNVLAQLIEPSLINTVLHLKPTNDREDLVGLAVQRLSLQVLHQPTKYKEVYEAITQVLDEHLSCTYTFAGNALRVLLGQKQYALCTQLTDYWAARHHLSWGEVWDNQANILALRCHEQLNEWCMSDPRVMHVVWNKLGNNIPNIAQMPALRAQIDKKEMLDVIVPSILTSKPKVM